MYEFIEAELGFINLLCARQFTYPGIHSNPEKNSFNWSFEYLVTSTCLAFSNWVPELRTWAQPQPI